MISFDFTFHSSDPLHWLLLAGLLGFLPGFGWLIGRNKTLSRSRKTVRMLLHLLLWLVLVLFVLQPVWVKTAASSTILVVGEEVPAAVARQWQDSLGLPERTSAEEFMTDKLAQQVDSVALLGQHFPANFLAQLVSTSVRWHPYVAEDQVSAAEWQGGVKQGEMQEFSGAIRSSKKQLLALRFAGKTLDSTTLEAGNQTFRLQFPVFSEGRSFVELLLDGSPIDTLRFFAQPAPTFSFQFILQTPDFESRTLADWLGRQGHTVSIQTTLSRNILQTTDLNRAADTKLAPDFILTDPENITNPQVKKALGSGKSVWVLGLSPAEDALVRINRALGVGFTVRKISTENSVSLAPSLTAQPYSFVPGLTQLVHGEFPVAIWKKPGKLMVSLLNETFPVKLSGDSLFYDRIWSSLLAFGQPAPRNQLRADAPVFSGLSSTVQLNNFAALPEFIQIGGDSVAVAPSPLNAQSATVDYQFGPSGWVSLGDSVEVYVQDSTASGYQTARLQAYMQAMQQPILATNTREARPLRQQKIPGIVWLFLFLSCFTALWLEPRFGK